MSNEACVFPFIYGGNVYTDCVTIDNDGVEWCTTQVILGLLIPLHNKTISSSNISNGFIYYSTGCTVPRHKINLEHVHLFINCAMGSIFLLSE